MILGLKSTAMISRWEKGVCLPDTLNIFKLTLLYRTMAEALFSDLVSEIKEEIFKKEDEILNRSDDAGHEH